MSEVPAVTDATFKEVVLDSANPVLVDFWAPWYGPVEWWLPLSKKLPKCS